MTDTPHLPYTRDAVRDVPKGVHPWRWAVICLSPDCPMNLTECAAFMGRSDSWLRRSDVPRTDAGGPLFLKSQVLAYLRRHGSHDLTAPTLKAA